MATDDAVLYTLHTSYDYVLLNTSFPEGAHLVFNKKLDFLHSMEKKASFYIRNGAFEAMLLLSYLASLDNKPPT